MMDSENHIFEPDVVMTSEFFGGQRTGLPDPERSLMIAVLEEASRCFLNYCASTDRKQRVLHEEACEWFRSAKQDHLYAFENVCNVLGIDPGWLRRRMFALRDERRARAGGNAPHRNASATPDDDTRAAG